MFFVTSHMSFSCFRCLKNKIYDSFTVVLLNIVSKKNITNFFVDYFNYFLSSFHPNLNYMLIFRMKSKDFIELLLSFLIIKVEKFVQH